MEYVLYSRAAVALPWRMPRLEINPSVGPAMAYYLAFDPAPEVSHWFVLGVSVVREYALRLTGPPAKKVFAHPRPWTLGGLEDSPGWHADHETLLHYSVSNACRSWRYAEEGFVSSKDDAAV